VGSVCGFHEPGDVEAAIGAGLLLVAERSGEGRGGAIAARALGAESAWTSGSDAASASPSSPGGDREPGLRRLWPAADGGAGEGGGEGGGGDAEPSCDRPPDRLSPHGMGSRETSEGVRLAVVSHGSRDAVELFDLVGSGGSARLLWTGCVPLPPETGATDVAFAPDGEILVNDYLPALGTPPSASALGAMVLASLAGRPTGAVRGWREGRGWRRVSGSEAPLANGIAVSPDGSTLYYSESATGRIARIPREGGAAPEHIAIGGNPHKLTWSPRGTLLALTHTDGAAIMRCTVLGQRPCRTGWALVEIDPASFAARERLRHDGSVVGAASSAAEVGGRIYLGSGFGDRIGVWRPPQ